ncbi:Membrane protein involved in the export of O-antigen and teichoic acid [Paucidesulfovibrio gracilis DSM 16080]|uniref:Membrane protein involved in the export of O-antigen and teichoic acid n=1 Tax=Paucidesulfovibrio gracilis DSM 16080 TaxID=1121449 RepID=A0A1T4XDL1_9BACT|nr:lipopolysaccharide biosynthesis protein [Paucidesulfovibrio gracilis]SKA87682.1 Membrane protein involved in the export of O-antigen and teichoic acid [Paucidesulfovibrio gracilis DSM 16080]
MSASPAKAPGFLRSVLTLLGGNVLAQAVNVGSIPIITRLFAPSAYGEFALAFSCITVLAALSHLRYNVPIMLPEAEEDADALTLLTLGLVTVFSLLLGIVVLSTPEPLRDLLGFQSTATILLLPPGCLFCGFFLTLQVRNLRHKGFHRQATAQVVGAVGSRSAVILCGLAGWAAPPVLASMKPASDFLVALVLAGDPRRGLRYGVFTRESVRRIPAMAKRYAQFPKYCGTDLVLSLNMELPTFLLALHYDPVRVGLYNLAVRVLKQPGIVVGTAIGKSFFQHTAQERRRGRDIHAFALRVLEVNLTLYLFPAVLLWAFAPDLFGFVFGPEWAEAGVFVRILLPVFLLTFTALFTGTLLDTLGLQRERFLFSLLQITVTAAGFTLGAALDPSDNAHAALMGLSAGSSLTLAVRMVWVMGKAGVRAPELARRILPPILVSAVLGAGFFTVRHLLAGHALATPAEIGLAALLLAGYLLLFHVLRFRKLLAQAREPSKPSEESA